MFERALGFQDYSEEFKEEYNGNKFDLGKEIDAIERELESDHEIILKKPNLKQASGFTTPPSRLYPQRETSTSGFSGKKQQDSAPTRAFGENTRIPMSL